MNTIDRILEILMTIIIGAVAVFFLAGMIYVPASMLAKSDCLAAGYPKAKVDWRLKGYCLNLDGAVTVAVESVDTLQENNHD